MKNKINAFIASAILALSIMSCSIFEVEKIPELNSGTIESIANGASPAQISQLAVGIQRVMPLGYVEVCQFGGSIGRESNLFNSTD